ncbi:hypothetical protein HQ590_09110 [bacterium]|nr:hypothetical protein [bacterium]
MTYWKRLVTKTWPWREELPLWQRDAWDRQLRRVESYDQKWEYVCCNPVRHELVEEPDAWPYQGELNRLPW